MINYQNEQFFLNLIERKILSIDEYGVVINNITGNELGKKPNNFGYKAIGFKHNRKTLHQQVHRLVHIIYNDGFTDEQPYCNHKDGNKWNNHFSNLEKSSNAENVKHAFDIGLSHPDELPHLFKLGNIPIGRKLSLEQANEIREKYATGQYTHRQLGLEYDMNHSTIGDLLRRQTFKN